MGLKESLKRLLPLPYNFKKWNIKCVFVPGYNILKLWLPLYLQDGGSSPLLNPEIKHSSVGLCLMLGFAWAHRLTFRLFWLGL